MSINEAENPVDEPREEKADPSLITKAEENNDTLLRRVPGIPDLAVGLRYVQEKRQITSDMTVGGYRVKVANVVYGLRNYGPPTGTLAQEVRSIVQWMNNNVCGELILAFSGEFTTTKGLLFEMIVDGSNWGEVVSNTAMTVGPFALLSMMFDALDGMAINDTPVVNWRIVGLADVMLQLLSLS